MADNGIRGLAPVIATPGTTLAAIAALTPPAGKEWTIRTLRATNISGADATVTFSVGGAAGEIAFNAPVKVGASVNLLGPDFATIPPATIIQARASATSAIRLVAFITERDL